MDIMSERDLFGEVEHMVSDNSFCDILDDGETFSDSHSESDWSDIGILDNIQETMIFDWSNEALGASKIPKLFVWISLQANPIPLG